MRLICYPVSEPPPVIRPAMRERAWMDASPEGFAYRCLPLTIANSHGWEILTTAAHEAVWMGGPRLEDIVVRSSSTAAPRLMSHFGSGVLTFDVGCIFRTEPGYNLWVSGPVNSPKDGVVPLAGVVETDWMPSTFTMNWLFTRPGAHVRFEAGEPFCMIFPLPRGLVDAVEPEVRSLASNPELETSYNEWRQSRDRFLQDLPKPDSEAKRIKWQKTYYRGQMPDGAPAPASAQHQVKLQPRPFADLRHEPGKRS